MKEIVIFCSASTEDLEKINTILVPSLEQVLTVEPLTLYLIDYTGTNKLKVNESKQINIKCITNNKQLGFGESHNYLFSKVKPKEFFIIINPDVYADENLITELIKKYKNSDNPGIIEARQLPFEHPKEVNPETGKTPWCSGFCLLIDTIFFASVSGFDKRFWMYCEDVDLSWRARLEGYQVYQASNAVGFHFTGNYFSYDISRFFLEQFWGARNYIYIMYKFWGEGGERRAIRRLNKTNYPKYFKLAVKKSFFELKNNLSKDELLFTKHQKYPKEIKVTGFNQYHKVRKVRDIW